MTKALDFREEYLKCKAQNTIGNQCYYQSVKYFSEKSIHTVVKVVSSFLPQCSWLPPQKKLNK